MLHLKRLFGVFTLCACTGAVANAMPADAATFLGTPSPLLNPQFGTLVNFDNLPAGTINSNDYASVGVSSITGSGSLQRFGSSSQSARNYIGNIGFGGSILFEFSQLVNKVGIGIASGDSTQERLNVFDSSFNLLESFLVPNANVLNIYAGFTRLTGDIKYLQVSGGFYAADDLQFQTASATAVPTPALLPGLIGLGVGVLRKRKAEAAKQTSAV